jgi:hypothetical protein
MPVSVDELKTYTHMKPAARRFGNQWSHLMVDRDDPLEELHRFALAIGLKRSWFQEHVTVPHYDVTASMRAKAIAAGAEELTDMQQVRRCYRGRTRLKVEES